MRQQTLLACTMAPGATARSECSEPRRRLRHARRRTITMDRYSPTKRRGGEPPHRRGSHRFLRDLVATAAVGGSRSSPVGSSAAAYFHLVHGQSTTKATKWALLLGPPSHPRRQGWRKSAVVAANVVSGARDQDPRPVHQGPPRGHYLLRDRIQSGELSNHLPDRIRAMPLATLWRRFRAWTRASHEYRFVERNRHLRL
jgi:hypothetical protein